MDNKKRNSIYIVYGIVFVLFSIIFFMIPFKKTGIAWLELIFSWLSIIAGLLITVYAFSKGENVKSKLYGFPVFRVGIIYMVVQLVFCLVFCSIAAVAKIATWIPALLSIMLIGAAAIGVIATDNARDIVQQVENRVTAETRAIKYFRLDVSALVDMCRDANLKKSLEKLSEEIRYSDPVSKPELEAVEQQMSQKVDRLRYLIDENNVSAAMAEVNDINALLADRNRRCKMLKNG